MIACPNCGELAAGNSRSARAAGSFCKACDFPLFFSDGMGAKEADVSSDMASRRRFPGVKGSERALPLGCWDCGEKNDPKETSCHRCGASLQLPPEAPAQVQVVSDLAEPALTHRSPGEWPFYFPFLAGAVIGGWFVLMVVVLLGSLG